MYAIHLPSSTKGSKADIRLGPFVPKMLRSYIDNEHFRVWKRWAISRKLEEKTKQKQKKIEIAERT